MRVMNIKIVTGIVKITWEQNQKIIGYFKVDDEQMEINQENITKVKSIMTNAKNKGVKIKQRIMWLNEDLNPLYSA
jgi:hypothetical protein